MHCCNRYATARGVQYTEEVETRYQQRDQPSNAQCPRREKGVSRLHQFHQQGIVDNACFKKLIRGKRSLGHFMNQEGLRAVPSPQEPGPMVRLTGTYFSGGFTVKKYGSRDEGVIDAIQMEFLRNCEKIKLPGKIQDGRWQELL